PRGTADEEDGAVGHRRRPGPEGADRRHGASEVGLAQRRPYRLRDLPIARLEPTAELAHSVLVTEERDHSLVVGNRAFINLEALIEGDPYPWVDGRIDDPVSDDAVAIGPSRSNRPAQAMTKPRMQAVRDGDEARANLAGGGDHRSGPIGVRSDVARFGSRAEMDERMVAERVGELRIEGEPPDP